MIVAKSLLYFADFGVVVMALSSMSTCHNEWEMAGFRVGAV